MNWGFVVVNQAVHGGTAKNDLPSKMGHKEHLLVLCLVVCVVLEREHIDANTMLRKLRCQLILKREDVPLPMLDALRNAA